jgi:3-oxoacyl-[acyl-carrier protein] reductase
MRGIAREVARHGVTANAISLGSIEPPVPDPSAAERAARYPVKRLGRPDDVAAAVVWLASEHAGWVTGQTISVNGGFNTAP